MNKIQELCNEIESTLDGTEINMSNYNDDNVKKLNDAMIEVSFILDKLKKEAYTFEYVLAAKEHGNPVKDPFLIIHHRTRDGGALPMIYNVPIEDVPLLHLREDDWNKPLEQFKEN